MKKIKLEMNEREIYLQRCYAAHYLNYLNTFPAPLHAQEQLETINLINKLDEALEILAKKEVT